MIDRRGVPLRPDWSAYERVPFLARAALASARHAFDRGQYASAEAAARASWPDDRTTLAVVQRAAVPGLGTNTTSALSQLATGEFLQSLAPLSAAASLFSAGPRISLGRLASITFPRRGATLDATKVIWIDEGAPSIVPRLNIVGGATLGPTKKLMSIVAASRELAEASDAENALDLMLRESASFSLDASVFSAAAATSAQPAGILNGIAALTPATVTAGKSAAMEDDLASLATAISSATSGLAYAGHPAQINSIRVRRGTAWDPTIPLWSSIAIPSGTIIACDPAGIVSAFGPDPEIRTVREASIAFDDSAAGAIIGGGQPAESLWQVDALALQLRLKCAWCVRVPGCVAFMNSVSW